MVSSFYQANLVYYKSAAEDMEIPSKSLLQERDNRNPFEHLNVDRLLREGENDNDANDVDENEYEYTEIGDNNGNDGDEKRKNGIAGIEEGRFRRSGASRQSRARARRDKFPKQTYESGSSVVVEAKESDEISTTNDSAFTARMKSKTQKSTTPPSSSWRKFRKKNMKQQKSSSNSPTMLPTMTSNSRFEQISRSNASSSQDATATTTSTSTPTHPEQPFNDTEIRWIRKFIQNPKVIRRQNADLSDDDEDEIASLRRSGQARTFGDTKLNVVTSHLSDDTFSFLISAKLFTTPFNTAVMVVSIKVRAV